MSGITVRSAFGKLQKQSGKDLRDEMFITGQPVGSNRRALDTLSLGVYLVGDDIVESGSDDNLVVLTAHGAKKGDLLRINTSANGIAEFEVSIDEVVDANSFRLSSILSDDLEAGDTVSILRPITPRLSATGATITTLDPSPICFRKDGTVTEVSEDTATPANTEPLPVKLVSTDGVNLTFNANQVNISLDHAEDSVKIGDGTRTADVTASNELKVSDAEALAKQEEIRVLAASLDGKDFATEATLELVRLLLVAIEANDFSTEAKQDTIITALGNLLTELQSIEGKDFATQTTLAALLAELQQKADLADTQPVSVASLPLPTGAATEAKQDTGNTSLGTIATGAGAPSDAAVTNPALDASIIAALKGILTLIGSTNTKIDSLETALTPELNDHETHAVTTVYEFVAPAGARKMIVQNSLESGAPIRFCPSANTPTSSDGFYLGVGQSTSEMAAGSFKAISTDGTAADVTVLWSV